MSIIIDYSFFRYGSFANLGVYLTARRLGGHRSIRSTFGWARAAVRTVTALVAAAAEDDPQGGGRGRLAQDGGWGRRRPGTTCA